MKTRFILLMLGLAFVVTLAVIVGQRLSAEAMAVMVGVVAGVAASIPTSLLVVWFANRALMVSRPMPEMPAPQYAPQYAARPMPVAPEPQQIVVMAPSNAYPNMSSYPTPSAPAYSLPTAPVSRQFTVIGGVETPVENSEVAWP